jgi:hypothetical protein
MKEKKPSICWASLFAQGIDYSLLTIDYYQSVVAGTGSRTHTVRDFGAHGGAPQLEPATLKVHPPKEKARISPGFSVALSVDYSLLTIDYYQSVVAGTGSRTHTVRDFGAHGGAPQLEPATLKVHPQKEKARISPGFSVALSVDYSLLTIDYYQSVVAGTGLEPATFGL